MSALTSHARPPLGTAPPATATVAPMPVPDAAVEVVPGGSRYGDTAWDLTALSGRPTANWITIDFARAPEPVREDLRHFIYLVLTTDTPVGALERPVSTRARLSPASIKSLWEDLRPFLDWLHERGTSQLAHLREEDLRDYARAVQDAPVTQPTRGRRLFALTRIWLYAPYLRPQARLSQPFWEKDGVAEVLGPNQWSPENKTPPIHPATMSALLVWCLRILEDAPALIARHHLGETSDEPPTPPTTLAWVDPATAASPARARQLLATAALIVTAYLTGMRADEVLALRRGCCTPTGRGGFVITGRTFKSAVVNGRSVPEGSERDHPWVAIKPVADAISAMEQLHPTEVIFPANLFRRARQGHLESTPPASNSRGVAVLALIEWANTRASELGRAHEAIPPDPDGKISLRRLRRTLAWFIYRRPRGRVALGIQYGHLHAATTDGYGNRASAGLRDLFPMEEALALSDTLTEAAANLPAHPTISGPAAARYRSAVHQYQARYGGLSLTARQAADLASNPAMRVYDSPGQVLACCFDPAKALCRRDTRASENPTTPDLSGCDSRCANIARTDTHIETLRSEVTHLHQEIASPATPEPFRARLTLRAQRHQALIDTHTAGEHE
ncbi:MAG: site-specific integrase [Dermatophilaceae bacterium]|jgi:integrase